MNVPLLKSDFSTSVHAASTNYLEAMDAKSRIEWALDHFGNQLVLTTSFGIQSSVLLHLATKIRPHIPIVFVDTQYLHPDIYTYKDMMKDHLGLNVLEYKASQSRQEQEAEKGEKWWETHKDDFDFETKIEPLNRAMEELNATAWLAGLRRGQNARRAELDVTEQQGALTKIYPLIDWSSKDIFNYMRNNGLPEHPAFAKGLNTVGNEFESGPGLSRGECGIHVQNVVRPSNFLL